MPTPTSSAQMSAVATLPEAITDELLEEMLSAHVPCGGVEGLGIRPCGSPAAVIFDRVVNPHCKDAPRCAADFKCLSCYTKWLDWMTRTLAEHGSLHCTRCDHVAYRIADFARYVAL